jgi:hypothetical protein
MEGMEKKRKSFKICWAQIVFEGRCSGSAPHSAFDRAKHWPRKGGSAEQGHQNDQMLHLIATFPRVT